MLVRSPVMSMNLQCSDEDFRTDMASSDSEDDSDEEEERHGNFVDDGSTAAAVSDQIFHLSEEKHRDTGCPEDFLFGHDCDDLYMLLLFICSKSPWKYKPELLSLLVLLTPPFILRGRTILRSFRLVGPSVNTFRTQQQSISVPRNDLSLEENEGHSRICRSHQLATIEDHLVSYLSHLLWTVTWFRSGTNNKFLRRCAHQNETFLESIRSWNVTEAMIVLVYKQKMFQTWSAISPFSRNVSLPGSMSVIIFWRLEITW